MTRQSYMPVEIIAKLRQVEVMVVPAFSVWGGSGTRLWLLSRAAPRGEWTSLPYVCDARL